MKQFFVVTVAGLFAVSLPSSVWAQARPDSNRSGSNQPDSVSQFIQAPTVRNEVASPPAGFYTLGAGDRLFMDIFNLPDFSREYDILADGTINLPLIGTVYAQGKTISQLATEVEARYAQFVRVPAVTFDLQQARSFQIAVAGEVRRPGSYPLAIEPGPQNDDNATTSTIPTVTLAIQTAGGITESADIRNIRVYRPDPQIPGEGQWIDINLWALIQEGDLSQDLVLRDGDSIVVPEATEPLTEESLAIAAANFSPDIIDVYIAGQVDAPGLVQLPPNTPLNQAILAAGGRISSASRRVTLVRVNPNGTVTKERIRIDLDADVNDEDNPILRHNDAILVGRSTLARVTDTLNTALSPFNGFLDILRIVDIVDEVTTGNDLNDLQEAQLEELRDLDDDEL
ncbi:MAG: SLBB domain-containing protein [Leptolyngbyaceae bacterium]|nr:SLBB domain-containing protein [Leptolyngbyaceae bacterium]